MIPTIGRIVHVLIGHEFDGTPVYRPAIVVRTWTGTCVNVQVFLDGSNDDRHVEKSPYGGPKPVGSLWWITSICHASEAGGGIHWIWPPASVPAVQAPASPK